MSLRNGTAEPAARRPTRREQLASEVQNHILERGLVSGDPLPYESELAKIFGVSRTVVREALKILEALKIVEIRHGKGVYVREPSIVPTVEQVVLKYRNDNSMLRSLAEARFLIEVAAAELAVRRTNPEQLKEMKVLLDRQKEALAAGNWDRTLDLEFHRVYLSMVNNPVLADWGQIIAEFFAREVPIERGPRFNDVTVQEHEEIYEALQARDARRLEYALRRHLELKRATLSDEPHGRPGAKRTTKT